MVHASYPGFLEAVSVTRRNVGDPSYCRIDVIAVHFARMCCRRQSSRWVQVKQPTSKLIDQECIKPGLCCYVVSYWEWLSGNCMGHGRGCVVQNKWFASEWRWTRRLGEERQDIRSNQF